MKVWHVTTGNYLHASKRVFRSQECALEHIRHIISKKPAWVTQKDIDKSYSVISINVDRCPDWERIYKVWDLIKEPRPLQKNELRKRTKYALKCETAPLDTASNG